jgi:Uma2 family endonuclease
MYQNNPALPVNTLPTMYDLPSENPEEMGLPDKFHYLQPNLLAETCLPAAAEFFIGVDLNLYYDVDHTGWYKRPDWFLVLGRSDSPEQSELRLSYLIWQEHVAPFLMVELLSPGTEAEDLGQTLRVVGKPPTKWQVYEQILRVPYYVVFDRYSNQFRMFCLQDTKYVEQLISGQGFWFDNLQLGLGVWSGTYKGVKGQWLRWYNAIGNWVLTEQEGKLQAKQEAEEAKQEAEEAKQEAEEAKQEAEEAKQEAKEVKEEAEEANQKAKEANQRADLLAAKLRELGIDVNGML